MSFALSVIRFLLCLKTDGKVKKQNKVFSAPPTRLLLYQQNIEGTYLNHLGQGF